MYFLAIVSFCVVGAAFGQCPDGHIEYACKPCSEKCSGEIVQCTKMCIPGCACPANTLVDEAGKCVTAAMCPYKCPKLNQVFYPAPKCAPPPTCHQTCASFLKDGKQPVACTDQCLSNRCGCPEGSLVDVNGHCVTEEQCKSGCEVGEYFYSYPLMSGCAPCQRQCDNYYKANVACTLECINKACRCAPGYVRNPNTNVKGCIPVEQCPINKNCGKNEMVPWNGVCAPCERTCDNFFLEAVPCTAECRVEVCVCKRGFVRNAQKVCVPIAECPAPTCGAGEKFYGPNECRPCKESCLTSNTPCNRRCVSNVCGCEAGFKRTSTNSCVKTCPAT